MFVEKEQKTYLRKSGERALAIVNKEEAVKKAPMLCLTNSYQNSEPHAVRDRLLLLPGCTPTLLRFTKN